MLLVQGMLPVQGCSQCRDGSQCRDAFGPGDALSAGDAFGAGMLSVQGTLLVQGRSRSREGRQSQMQSQAAAALERSDSVAQGVGTALEGTVAGARLGAHGARLCAGCCRCPGSCAGCRGEGEHLQAAPGHRVPTTPWRESHRAAGVCGCLFLGAELEIEPGTRTGGQGFCQRGGENFLLLVFKNRNGTLARKPQRCCAWRRG